MNCLESPFLQSLLTQHSVKPKYLTDPAPGFEQLELAARAALRVPDHGGLVPFRFVLVEPGQREQLASLFARAAQNSGADAEKTERARSKAHKGPGLVAFIVRIDPDSAIDEHEQWLTAGAAMQQFFLAIKAQGFDGIILSGSVLSDATLQQAFCRHANERVMAWYALGTPAADRPAADSAPKQDILERWAGSV